MKRKWITSAGLLALIWMVALSGRCALRNRRETAEKIAAFTEKYASPDLSGRKREAVVDRFIARVNRLSFKERQQLGTDQRVRRFVGQLDDEERLRIFEETLPSGMSEMMEAFNQMDPEKRQKFVERARKRFGRVVHEIETSSLTDEEQKQMEGILNTIARQGFRVYLSEADAQAKLDLQPLMIQMQNMMQKAKW